MEINQQELMLRLSVYEQQINQLQEQIQAIEKGIVDINILNIGLDELRNAKGKEIFAPIGKGIFVKSKIEADDLIVDIGEGKMVSKTVDETKKILEKQTIKFEEIKNEMKIAMENLGREFEKSMQEYSEENQCEHDCKCHPGEKCDCDDDECEGKCECGKN
ncbi:prefoldin subunit alpha [Candidatus Pacearchaeota archaeon]|nr:prefoldin subunit alpha [Candidatus Pacearchaeota archaeon]